VAKQLLFDDRARLKLQKGVETLAQAVAVTMGRSKCDHRQVVR
jgi:chaperonin GroEL